MGDLHISIAVLDASAAQGTLDQPVLDANVQVTLKPLVIHASLFVLCPPGPAATLCFSCIAFLQPYHQHKSDERCNSEYAKIDRDSDHGLL